MRERSEAQLAAQANRKAKTRQKYQGLARNAWWMKARGYNQAQIARYLSVSPTIVKRIMEMFPPK